MQKASSTSINHQVGVTPQWIRVILAVVLIGGCFFNNVVRWYPFPVGRSANEMVGLEDNLNGIVFNVFLFAVALVASVREGGFAIPRRASALVGCYCFVIAVQSFFREELLLEAARSLAWILHFGSALYLGACIGRRPELTRLALKYLLFGQCLSVIIGAGIAIQIPGSVNVGLGMSWEFSQYSRGEFFFLWVPPVMTVALGVAWLREGVAIRGWRWWLVLSVVCVVVLLSVLTMTRTYVFGIMLVLWVVVMSVKRIALLSIACGVIGAVLLSERLLTEALLFLRVIADDPLVEFTGGRQELNKVLLETFAGSPWVGVGGQEMRRVILSSALIAKSEHGYTSHLASFGVAAFLYFGFMAYAAVCVWKDILAQMGGLVNRRGPSSAWRACLWGMTAFTVSSGVVGLMGAASSFGDWAGLLCVQIFLITRARKCREGADCAGDCSESQ